MKTNLHSTVFSKFLTSGYGKNSLNNFNKIKKDLENPADYIIKNASKGRIYNYLEIGGGDGLHTIPIIRALKPGHVDFLEPSNSAPTKFSKFVRSKNINFSIINTTFEKFNTNKKYDLITSIHSWYYINLKSLEKLYGLIENGGTSFIFLDSKHDMIKTLENICERELYNYKSNDFEDVIAYLDRKRIGYKVYKYDTVLSGLLKNGEFTREARTIISLISWKNWKDIPDGTKSHIKKALIRTGRSNKYPSRRRLIVIRKYQKQ